MEQLDRPPTLTEAAAERIKKEILSGRLPPGSPLHELGLSKTLSISRGTVREALRTLQQDGLTDVIAYRGAFVAKLSLQKVKEIYTLRALLEPYAVRLSMECGAFDRSHLEEMGRLVKHMGELEESGDDYAELIETDIRLHEMSSERCGHALLLDILKNLQSQTLMFILNTKLYQSDMVSDEVSHQSIFNGILSGDPTLAEEVVRQHINDAGSSLVKRMEEVDWNPDSHIN